MHGVCDQQHRQAISQPLDPTSRPLSHLNHKTPRPHNHPLSPLPCHTLQQQLIGTNSNNTSAPSMSDTWLTHIPPIIHQYQYTTLHWQDEGVPYRPGAVICAKKTGKPRGHPFPSSTVGPPRDYRMEPLPQRTLKTNTTPGRYRYRTAPQGSGDGYTRRYDEITSLVR